jgi:hypothetical protein
LKSKMNLRIKILIGILVSGIVLSSGWWDQSSQVYSETSEVAIATDKTAYEQGEIVKIIIINNLDHLVVPQFPCKLESRSMGGSFGIGAIEKFEEGVKEWIPVEPVWRCGHCEECKYKYSFEPGEKRVFEWNQTILNCPEKIEEAAVGKYRVSSNIDMYGKELASKTIYSNEFTIKGKHAEN